MQLGILHVGVGCLLWLQENRLERANFLTTHDILIAYLGYSLDTLLFGIAQVGK